MQDLAAILPREYQIIIMITRNTMRTKQMDLFVSER